MWIGTLRHSQSIIIHKPPAHGQSNAILSHNASMGSINEVPGLSKHRMQKSMESIVSANVHLYSPNKQGAVDLNLRDGGVGGGSGGRLSPHRIQNSSPHPLLPIPKINLDQNIKQSFQKPNPAHSKATSDPCNLDTAVIGHQLMPQAKTVTLPKGRRNLHKRSNYVAAGRRLQEAG